MLDTRLGQIEKHLSGLNIKWQNTDATLRNQNMRITNIEGHINDLTNVKRDMVRVENRVELMNNGMKKTDERMRDYEQSLQVFNDKCEDVMSDSRTTDAAVNSLYDKVEQLEADRQKLNESNQRLNETVIDLQCRSMRDNLIFTGIEEPDYRVDQQEDTEQVLCEFLKYEMNIEPNISFHRVHRLGYNQRYTDYPRPIVAKFEHFKDRELVRLAAPKTLRGKHYGVREQFPKVVEDKRKLLYPEMKRAKADKTNKVRLVRDKLFVNNIEVKPNLKQVADQNEFELRGRSRDRHHNHRFDDRRAFDRSESGYAKSRVFQRSTNKNTVSSTRAIELAHGRKFQLPLSNKFDGLQTLQDDFICEINGNQELFDENMEIFHCFENNNIPLERINIDKITNSYGYQLVEFCKNNNIFIMNGRFDAQLPSLTCKNSSTVDYLLATANTFENISAFHVLKFDSLYSDAHCPLSVNIKTMHANTSKTTHQPPIGTIPEVKLWDSNKSDLFTENINYDEISKINSFLDVLGTEQNVHIHNINETVRRIENLFISNSKASFGQKRIKPNSHRQNTTNKQWFNKECRDARNTYHNVRRFTTNTKLIITNTS